MATIHSEGKIIQTNMHQIASKCNIQPTSLNNELGTQPLLHDVNNRATSRTPQIIAVKHDLAEYMATPQPRRDHRCLKDPQTVSAT